MPNRVIKSIARTSSLELTECLGSLLALELMSPGRFLYVISPWISDVPLLESFAGRFRPLLPDQEGSIVRLAPILNSLAERETSVRIICRSNHGPTDAFIDKLIPQITVRRIETLHEKGLISETFYLRGSMNLTYAGVNLNDEHVELTTEPDAVAQAVRAAHARWEASDL